MAFAIMDYDHPGRSRASANIGDHVQSLASLGHLVRHADLDFDGPQDLVDLVGELRGRVRPELARHGRRGPRAAAADRPRRLRVRHRPGGHLDAGVRLVHARAVPEPLRLPPAPGAAAAVHLLPRQQARPAGPGGDRPPPPLRPDRLPRLDDGGPAALGRGPSLLLGLHDDNGPHRVPGPGRPAAGRRPRRLRRRARVDRAGRRGDLRPQQRQDPLPQLRAERRRRGHPAGDLPAPSTPAMVTSRLHCYLPVRALGVPVDFHRRTAPTRASPG